MEVYNDQGNTVNDVDSVLNKWKCDFESLYKGYDSSEFDQEFYDYALHETARLESLYNENNDDSFNNPITIDEVRKVLGKTSNHKSVGIGKVYCPVLNLTEF